MSIKPKGAITSLRLRCERLSCAMVVTAWMLLLGLLSSSAPRVSTTTYAPQKQHGRPLVIAHRGGAQESTENTIGAFQRAVPRRRHGIETDIRLTRDGRSTSSITMITSAESRGWPSQRTTTVSDSHLL